MADRNRQKKNSTPQGKRRGLGKSKAKRTSASSRGGAKSIILFGSQACWAVFNHRPEAINRVCILREISDEFDDIRVWCKKNRRPFKEVGVEELRRIAGSEHHEGVVFDINPKPQVTLADLFASSSEHDSSTIIVLEGVQNPHNIGAIARTACFFGALGIVVVNGDTATMSSAAYRIAEGALEQIPVLAMPDIDFLIEAIHAEGYTLYATTPHEATSVYEISWAKKRAVFFGAERHGLSQDVLERIENRVVIPRSGALESLNVGAAVASMLIEIQRPS